MRFSECTHRLVLDTSNAEEIGRVDAFAVDPGEHRIRAVVLGKSQAGAVLPWSEIKSFGPDAITVESRAAVRDATDDDEPTKILGQRLLTDHGYEVGSVDDVEFDESTGELQDLVTGDRTIDAAALIGIGSYAVVVEHDATTG